MSVSSGACIATTFFIEVLPLTCLVCVYWLLNPVLPVAILLVSVWASMLGRVPWAEGDTKHVFNWPTMHLYNFTNNFLLNVCLFQNHAHTKLSQSV